MGFPSSVYNIAYQEIGCKSFANRISLTFLYILHNKERLSGSGNYGILPIWENHRAGRLPFFFGGANPPDEGKEGVANDDYIF